MEGGIKMTMTIHPLLLLTFYLLVAAGVGSLAQIGLKGHSVMEYVAYALLWPIYLPISGLFFLVLLIIVQVKQGGSTPGADSRSEAGRSGSG